MTSAYTVILAFTPQLEPCCEPLHAILQYVMLAGDEYRCCMLLHGVCDTKLRVLSVSLHGRRDSNTAGVSHSSTQQAVQEGVM